MRGPADISPARLDWTLAVRSLFAWVGGAMRPQKQLPAKPGAPGVPAAIPADYYAAGPYVATRSQQTDALRLAILANPDALAAVAGIAREIAARPVIVRTEADPTPREHPVFALLDSAPGFTREQLVERLIADVLLTGNALVEVLGRPTPVTPRAGVLVLRDATDLYAELDRAEATVTAYRYEGPDGTRYIAPSNILHAAVNRYGTGQDGVFGVSPLAPLYPDFERAARDAAYLRDRPRGPIASIGLRWPGETPPDEVAGSLRLMRRFYETTGYHVALRGAEFESLPESKEQTDVLALQNAMLDSIIRALGLAPVLWNRSVTNDSAAKEQHRAYRAMLHALSGVVWTAFQPLMDRLGSTDLYLASDWSGDAADAEIEDQERRAKLAEIHVRNGLPVATAYQLAGIEIPAGATDATQSQGPRLLLAR
jgi:hypothetical protein